MLLQKLVALIAWVGIHARVALPIAVFVGLALPSLAALFRPLLTAAVIGTLTSTVLRLDWGRLQAGIRNPRLPLQILGWQLLGAPLVMGLLARLIGLPAALALLVLLQSAAPPLGSVAAFAMFIGLDATTAMVGTIVATLALPLTLTALVSLALPGPRFEVALLPFFGWVVTIVALPFLLAWLIRRGLGVQRLTRHDDLLAGVNVILLIVFAIAAMDGITARAFAEPLLIAGLLGLSCAATVILHALGYLLFARHGVDAGFTAALLSGNRNMGLMLALTAGAAGDLFSLYVGLTQIPMYFSPLLVEPLLRRKRGQPVRPG